jgi:hypothetical protein
LLEGYQARHASCLWVQIATGDSYLLGNLAWHLARAGRDSELVDLLSNLSWMHARITGTSLPDLIATPTTPPIPASMRSAAP